MADSGISGGDAGMEQPVMNNSICACQLLAGGAGGIEPPHWYVRRLFMPVMRSVARRLRRSYWDSRAWCKRILKRVWPSCPMLRKALTAEKTGTAMNEVADSQPLSLAPIVPGMKVRVRSQLEIDVTLDATGRCRGCAFLAPMAAYCGQVFQVARCVGQFFDERQWRMLKCKNVVLLEGVYCDGSGHPDTRGCDRMCFFFWRTEWLEVVE
ncbi:MAG: hypothetical protein JXA69_14450 [Phycisphaerae bacterium]|nr:hypothetical protein [Phycisphaerae bacterium]